MKIDRTVKKETLYICAGMIIMSALMEAVFLVIEKWSIGVLFSNLLIGAAMVLNFFLMGLTVQKAVSYGDENKAKNLMKISQGLRFLAMAGIIAVGALLSDIRGKAPFSFWALIPPLFFNRITMMIRGFMIKKEAPPKTESAENENDDTEDE
ncbi:MAG: hypothetical protein J5832_05535 [Clostridia bacterium]|nr:hypothetical protein [Clostridia bacterium]